MTGNEIEIRLCAKSSAEMELSMKIWAHRGCSQRLPENTMMSFSRAAEIQGLAGIELDIQMTKDGKIVVVHDERVDRTTDGTGYVKDFTYQEIRKLRIDAGNGRQEKVPSMDEVLDLLENRMKQGMLLNIELKNGNIHYAGMEDKILNEIAKRGLEKWVVYSSFYVKSLVEIRRIAPEASVGILDLKASDCYYKKKGAFGNSEAALHPFWKEMDFTKEQLTGQTVRAWFLGHLYPEPPTGTKLNIKKLEEKGITDIFLNEPEAYLIPGS